MKDRKEEFNKLFAGWLEGKLTEKQAEYLRILMEENSEFDDDFETFPVLTSDKTNKKFARKDMVKKTVADFPDPQFEHLCIASVENDLSAEEAGEFNEMIAPDRQRQKTFALYSSLKLRPRQHLYKYKRKLKKATPVQKVLRIASWSLGAAATGALLIVAFISSPGPRTPKHISSAETIKPDTLSIMLPGPIRAGAGQPALKQSATGSETYRRSPATGYVKSHLSVNAAQAARSDSTWTGLMVPEPSLEAVGLPQFAFTPAVKVPLTGLRQFRPEYVPSEFEDERSNVDRFFAGIFHRVIMKDTIAPERQVERHEIAQAGISGINKLFGWQMALERNTAGSDTRSYYFSPKLFRINAPAKKANSL